MPLLHSPFGASSMAIVMECAGAYHAQQGYEDESNPAAEEGTAAHAVSEMAMALGTPLSSLVGLTVRGYEVTMEMVAYLEVYVGEVARIMQLHPDAVLMLEKRVTMHSVGDDVFGTGDVMIYVPSARKLYNIDLKYGFGVVDVHHNVQLAHYMVAALDTFGLWSEVDTIEGVIVQPRKETIDGVVRRETCTVAEAAQWQQRFKNQIAIARQKDAPRAAGKHCTYCKARGTCRVRLQHTFSLIGLDAPLHEIDIDELVAVYNETTAIKNHLEAVAKELIRRGREGQNFHRHGYKMVKAIARHTCKDADALVADLRKKYPKLKDEDLFNSKIKSKTDLKKLKDADGKPLDKKLIDSHFEAPPVSNTIAPIHDKRVAVGRGAAIGVFGSVTGSAASTTAVFDAVPQPLTK